MGLGVIALGLLIYCAVDCIITPKHKVRVLPKIAWFFIILLLPLLGAGLWLGFGKARGGGDGGDGRPRKGPVAPDDDPEFLRTIEFERRRAERREEEARKRAEEERKKRAAEQRRKQKNDDDAAAGRDAEPPEDPTAA